MCRIHNSANEFELENNLTTMATSGSAACYVHKLYILYSYTCDEFHIELFNYSMTSWVTSRRQSSTAHDDHWTVSSLAICLTASLLQMQVKDKGY